MYDATDYERTSREPSPTKKYESTSSTTSPETTNPSSVLFSEIRSLKRIERTHESVGTTDATQQHHNRILDTVGITDPSTGRTLTVSEAIQMRILDVRTGEIVINTRGERVPVSEAVRRGLIDAELANSLLQPGAAHDQHGRAISLLEVIQKEILDAENGYDATERRIKVTRYNDDDKHSVPGKSMADAISDGVIDAKSGLYRTESGTLISITEAYERGYLLRHETVKIKANSLCLADAIVHGLVDTSGWVVNRNSGDKFRLDTAIANGLITSDIREVVDARNDVKVTLNEAMTTGIINAKTGRYTHNVTKEKLTFGEAASRRLICKPMTLKDVCDLNLLEKSGRIYSPSHRSLLNIVEAMKGGILDSDQIKSIAAPKGELLTLSDALVRGVILPISRYRDLDTNEELSIPDAVDRGLISSVSQRSIFNIDGFKDPSSEDFISLNQALSKNILRRKSGSFRLDTQKGSSILLSDAVEEGVLRPEVHEMLSRKVGVADPQDPSRELSVLDLVYYDLIDPQTGYLLDPNTKAIVPLDRAIENKFITPEGALLLSSLLNITLTTETVTKTIKRYVTITGDDIGASSPTSLPFTSSGSSSPITFTDAVRQGMIDEKRQQYTDATTGKVYSIQQALNYGLIAPDTDAPPLPMSPAPKTSTITIVRKSVIPDIAPQAQPRSIDIRKASQSPNATIHTVETKTTPNSRVSDFLSSERNAAAANAAIMERQLLEMPSDGWFLSEAIKQKLFDPKTGLFVIPGTDRLVSFEECIKLQIINPHSVSVIDPQNDRKTSVIRSFEKRILDATGNYKAKKRFITMPDAISQGLIVLENPTEVDTSNQRLIQITKISGKPDVVEVSNKLDSNPPTFRAVKVASIDLPSPEPVQLADGVIYDPSTALVIFTQTGKSESIVSAVESGRISPNLVNVTDPATGETMNLAKAIARGIVDPNSGTVKDKSGNKIDLIEAVKFGLLAVVGTPLVAAAGAINSLKLVFDPKTGEQIPIELAYERGIVTKEEAFADDAGLVYDQQTGQKISLAEAAKRGLINTSYAERLTSSKSSTVVASITDPRTGETMDLEEAVSRGLISAVEAQKLLSSDTIVTSIPDPQTGQEISIEDAIRRGLITSSEAKNLVDSEDASVITNTTFHIQRKSTSSVIVKDPRTGEDLSIEEAITRGLISPTQGEKLLCVDSSSGTKSDAEVIRTLSEAMAKTGILSAADAEELLRNSNAQITIKDPGTGEKISLADALLKGLITEAQAQQLLATAAQATSSNGNVSPQAKTLPLESISLADGTLPSQSDLTRSRITSEPTYQVAIGRARSFSQSPEKEARPVVLQKMRKKIIRPRDACDKGIIDEETASMLETRENFLAPNGEPITLAEVVAAHKIDGTKGKIVDPQRGDVLNISQAMQRGILDPEGTNQVLVPLNKSLSVPQLADQGLLDPSGLRVIHPETGTTLTLKDAIVCEIVDPYSQVTEPTGHVISVEEAIAKGCIDSDDATVLTRVGSVNLLSAIQKKVFPSDSRTVENMPPLGMTFQIALKRGLIDLKSHEVVHPINNGRLSITDAIRSDFIMALPYTPNTDGISIERALTENLIDPKTQTFRSPTTNQVLPVAEAIECGLLVIKPMPELVLAHASGPVTSVTETVTSYHTITTKTIELLTGFVLVSANEVQNVQTGESFTMDEAKKMGIVKDESQTQEKFATREIKVNFSDAIKRGLVDIRAGTYTDPDTGAVMPIQEAVDTGILATQSSIDDADEDSTEGKVELMTLTEAMDSIFDDKTKQFRDPKNPERLVNFDEAIREGIVDGKSVVYDIQSGKAHTLEEGIRDGFIDPKTGEIQAAGSKINVKEAAKLGLLAVVGAPILAGMAVAGAVKKVMNKLDDSGKPETRSVISTITTSQTQSESSHSGVVLEKSFNSEQKPSDMKPISIGESISNLKEPSLTKDTSVTKDPFVAKATLLENKPPLIVKSRDTNLEEPNKSVRSSPEAISVEEFSEVIPYDEGQYSQTTTSTTIVSQHVEVQSISSTTLVTNSSQETVEITQHQPDVSDQLEKEQERIEELDQVDELPRYQQELVQELEQFNRKAKSPEKHVSFEFATESELTSSNNEPRGEQMLLSEALSQKKINHLVCRIIYNGKELDKTVQTALENGDLLQSDLIEILTPNLVVLLDKPQSEVDLSNVDSLSPEHIAAINGYDFEAECFLDPQTGERISFASFMYDLNIIDPDQIYVKDLSLNVFEPLQVALERPLIDKHTGHMVDSKSGKRVPFFDCVARGWIVQKPEEEMEAVDLQDSSIDPQTGAIQQEDGSKVSISDAINSGMIDVDNISIRDPATGEIIPMTVAIERGIVDLKRGVIFDSATGKEVPLSTVFAEGGLIKGLRKPISLEAVVKQGLYDPKTGKIMDKIDELPVDLVASINKGIVDPRISLIRDTKTKRLSTLTEAIDENLADPSNGTIRDTAQNKSITLDEAIAQDILSTKPTRWDLILDILGKQYYAPESGKILNPMTGEHETLKHGIEVGFVDISSTLVRDEAHDLIVPAEEAIRSGLLDPTRGVLTKPELTLDNALQKGYLMSNKKPLSLIDALARNLYDPLTGLFNIDGQSMTLEEAIAAGLINPNDLIVRDPDTGAMCSLAEAIRRGLIQPKMGLFVDPHSGLKLSLLDALDRSLLIQSKRRCSLPDAVFKGLYDPKSGTFSSTVTSEKLSTDRAIKRGIIDPQSTIVHVNGKVLPFELAVESGIVNARRGTVLDDYGNKIDFREAFDRGILIEVKKPISLAEALLKGLYDETTGLFMDPKTGQQLTIAQSLARKLIDPNSVQMKDPITGIYRDISLFEATESGLINGQNAQVLFGNDRISLQAAFDTGLLSDSKAPISIQRAIHQGLYDEKTGKLNDPHTGRKITLLEATRKFIVNPQLPCYFNERDEQLLSLAETCRSHLIDRREGVFKEPGSDVFIPLNEAMALGLIVDIENAGFGLYEALAMGMYDKESKLMLHPVSNRKLTLKQACKEDIVNQLSSLIKNQESGKYVKLDEALKLGLINDDEGVYVLPKYSIDLQEARQRGLIVTNQKLLSIEKAVKNQLFRPDTGKFVDPSSCNYYDLHEAIEAGLIDPETTVFKNLQTGQQKPINQAVSEGDIDVTKGRVLDPKTKRSYNYDVALSNGLLVTVDRPITGRSLARRESIDVLATSPVTKSPREMSLDDAIRYEIINPETAVVKDPLNGKFKTLQHRLDAGTVDLTLRTVVDPKSLFFAFDPTFIVYAREPLSFDAAIETKCLDLSTGKFTSDATVYALKDAIVLGMIDPESALIKDGAKNKLIRLPEACRKGLVDADKANVLDTSTSKLHTLQAAVDTGLLITPKRAMGLLEALSYQLYNPTTGGFSDPFITTSVIDRKRLTLADAIAAGSIDPTSTMVRDTGNGTIVPLVAAISSGLVDAVAGRLVDAGNKPDSDCDLLKARDRGLLLPAEQRVSFCPTNSYHNHTRIILSPSCSLYFFCHGFYIIFFFYCYRYSVGFIPFGSVVYFFVWATHS